MTLRRQRGVLLQISGRGGRVGKWEWIEHEPVHPEFGELGDGRRVDRAAARRHADLERPERRRAVELAYGLAESLDTARRRGDVQRESVPAVPALDGASVGGRRVATDHHRRATRLDRSGVGVDAGEVRVVPLEARGLLGPERAHGVDVLVGAGAALRERHTDRAHLRFEVAGADPEDQPALRQHVEARHLFGEHQGVALREDDDARAEAQRRGSGGDEGQVDEGIQDRVTGLHRCRWYPRAWEHDVLAGPHRVVAEFLRLTGQGEGGIGRVHRQAVEAEDAKFHGR